VTSRRVSRRRYLVRRATVLGLLVLGGFGVVRMAGALGGGDAESASPETTVAASSTTSVSDTTATSTAPTVAPVSDAPATTVAPTTAVPTTAAPTTVPTTTAPPTTVPGPPSAENPAHVLVVGDSFAGLWGPPLSDMLDETGIVETEIDYRMSTGLARPTKFDWFGRLEESLLEADPDFVITSFGGNDFVGLQDDDGSVIAGDPVSNEAEWVAGYQRRAGRMMDLLAQEGRTVIWVGTANHPDPAKSDGLALQDRAAKAAAAERPGVVFVDTWDLLAGRDGGWAEYVIDPRDGVGKSVRMADGFHPNETGSEILAWAVAEQVRIALVAQGAVL
jgi:uncharacterized protein